MLAGEPPLADSSNAASYNKIWQQHDENKTWQQQALDVEKVRFFPVCSEPVNIRWIKTLS